VSFSFAAVRPRAWFSLSIILLPIFSLAACTDQPAPPPDAATLLQSVPDAEPSKFPALKANKHWSNPYLLIRPEMIGLLTDVAPNEEKILKPEQVLDTLANLPASAWPYGRAVAILVEDKRANSDQERVSLRRNRGFVAGDLERANVAILWIAKP
jgi:hypothetical protein